MNEKKERILVVDDQPVNIKMLASALKQDYQISIATNGEQCWEIVTSGHRPDLVLLDIVMPGEDGYQICRRMQRDEQTRNIPVIFISSKDMVEDETRGFDMGAVDYIAKPFSLPIVKARIRTHLELKRHRDHLERLSNVDGLTGIANRRRFDDLFTLEWRRAKRNQTPLGVILMDIDHFKKYNDGYGHGPGDQCLQRVAQIITNSAKRATDLVARYGGEEFVALFPDTDLARMRLLAERIRDDVYQSALPHEFAPIGRVTLSLGVASLIPSEEVSPAHLLKTADQGLYLAKEAGRNRLGLSQETDTRAGMLQEVEAASPEQNLLDLLKDIRPRVENRTLDEETWKKLEKALDLMARKLPPR